MAMRFRERSDFLETAREITQGIVAVYADGEYIVEKHEIYAVEPFSCRLVIKRFDKQPVRSWREIQDIKNEVVGHDAIAIEIYPVVEADVTDTANLYHLWVLKKGYAIPAILIPPE